MPMEQSQSLIGTESSVSECKCNGTSRLEEREKRRVDLYIDQKHYCKKEGSQDIYAKTYHELNKETRASLQKDKKEWYGEVANELENAAVRQDMKKMYQL